MTDQLFNGLAFAQILLNVTTIMKTVKGAYKNGVIILDENGPEAEQSIPVLVTFLEEQNVSAPDGVDVSDFSFQQAQEALKGYAGSLSDAIIEERREAS